MPMLAGTVDAKLYMHWNLACLKLGCKGRDLGIRGRVAYQTGQTLIIIWAPILAIR